MRPDLEKAGPTDGVKQSLKQKCELETTERMRHQVFFACFAVCSFGDKLSVRFNPSPFGISPSTCTSTCVIPISTL
jgi:hypothetical protein